MNSNVIARLTVVRQNGMRTIVEVHADATFHTFFKFYTQQGSKRSTKQVIRSASRNEGLNPINAHLQTPGLELIAIRLLRVQAESNPVISTRIRYFSKRTYRKMIKCAPEVLGMSTVRPLFADQPAYTLRPIGIPVSFKQVEKINHQKLFAGSR
jgi:hypothetical protein